MVTKLAVHFELVLEKKFVPDPLPHWPSLFFFILAFMTI